MSIDRMIEGLTAVMSELQTAVEGLTRALNGSAQATWVANTDPPWVEDARPVAPTKPSAPATPAVAVTPTDIVEALTAAVEAQGGTVTTTVNAKGEPVHVAEMPPFPVDEAPAPAPCTVGDAIAAAVALKCDHNGSPEAQAYLMKALREFRVERVGLLKDHQCADFIAHLDKFNG